MDEKMISKQLTEVINLTNVLCTNEPINIKLLKAHKVSVNNLIRGYKNSKIVPVGKLEKAYNQVVLKLESIM